MFFLTNCKDFPHILLIYFRGKLYYIYKGIQEWKLQAFKKKNLWKVLLIYSVLYLFFYILRNIVFFKKTLFFSKWTGFIAELPEHIHIKIKRRMLYTGKEAWVYNRKKQVCKVLNLQLASYYSPQLYLFWWVLATLTKKWYINRNHLILNCERHKKLSAREQRFNINEGYV